MNICILTHTFPKYPDDVTAAFMHPLVMGIKNAGDEVTVLTPFHSELVPSSFPYPIISYKYIWPDRLHVLGYSQTLRQGAHLRLSSYLLIPFLVICGIITLLRLTKNKRYDLISAHWIIPNGIIAAVVSLIRNIPFTVTLPGSDVYVAQKNAIFSFLTRWAAERAAIVCADSPQYLTELGFTGAQAKRREVIPYPVDLQTVHATRDTQSLRKKLGISPTGLILVSVGRLVEKKGIIYALRAVPAILRHFPNAQYVIVGDGDMRDLLEGETRKLNIATHVHFVGNIGRGEISRYYSLADVIVVPSIKDHEGNIDDRPVALIESMACGKPVIATRFPGNTLSIDQGKSGMLIPQKNPQAIERAVLQLFHSPALRRRLGKEAQKRVKAKFSHTTIGKHYHKLFFFLTSHNA